MKGLTSWRDAAQIPDVNRDWPLNYGWFEISDYTVSVRVSG